MGKVIVVSEYISSTRNSTGYFWEKAIERLVDDGFHVEAVTLPEEIEDSARKYVLVRAWVKLQAAVRLAWATGHKVARDDVVLSGTNPETLLLILAVLRKLFGFRWHVLVHDVFPENLVPGGVLTREAMSYRVLKAVFDRVYAKADKLIVIGRDMQELVGKKVKDGSKVVCLHNWVDASSILPQERSESEIIADLKWSDKKVFQFFGNIGRLQGVKNVLDAIGRVNSPKAAFLFIGTGVEAHSVTEYMTQHPEVCLHYYGGMPQEQKNVGLAACDVAVIALAQGMYGLGVPSKAYFSMAADRPILAIMDPGSEIAMMVEEEGVGWTCPADDPAAIAAKIDEICEIDLTSYAGRMRALMLDKYSKSSALKKLSRAMR